jgi:DNA gyrase/topoisomerase IV subunit A
MITKTISEVVPQLYYNDGVYVNEEKMIPLMTDGLIPVHRRVLFSTHNIANTWVKTKNVMGDVVGKYHPHNLDKGPFVWAVHNGFILGKGSWGSDVGKEEVGAAAERYTNIKRSDDVEQMAFEFIKHTSWRMGDLDYEEPVYLPTMYPFCLIASTDMISIGFGLKTQIPSYPRKELYKRLMYLLGKGNKFVPTPNIPGCDILSSKKELEELCTTGKSTLKVKGKYTTNDSTYTINILGWSPRVKYPVIEKKIDSYNKWNLISNGDVGSNDDSVTFTDIRFEVTRRNGRQEIYEKLKESVGNALDANVGYEVIMVDDSGKVRNVSIDEMLLHTYKTYQSIYDKYLKYTIGYLNECKNELDNISKLKPYLSDSLKHTGEKAYTYLVSKTGLTIDVIKAICTKYKISKLMTVDVDSSKILLEIKELERQLKDIDNETILRYKTLN